ncbi:MAG: TetR/AcrR family transcriptional regulator [Deltaproteobacteria bacterium]|nr:TetR/AcrR family transcriptional regulator [Deltaproteobacteria bacterium]
MSKKNAILLAATELFSQKGYDGASMAELSRMTGAAGGTIFHHFKNKEDLFLNILGGIKETILSAFDQYLKDANFRNGLELVEGAVSFYLQLASRMQAQFLLLHRHFPYKMAEANPVCRNYLESIYDCLLDIFEKGILMGQKDGSVDGVPARQSAMILFSMVDGIARFNTYQLYDAGALYSALMAACRKMIGLKRPTDDDAVT